MKVRIITFGCKVNTYESEVIKEKFILSGYEISEDVADIIIINTCSVTNVADSKGKRTIRKMKGENPSSILVVCGCTAENHQETLSELGVDILIGNKDKSKIVELVENFIDNKKPYIKFYDNKSLEFEDMKVDKFTKQTRAFIKIQDGCDNYCSYCIIPFMRGNIRFKDFDKCIKEAENLVSNGHKEIVLTGIHTGSYGRGKDKDITDLIKEMSKIEGLERIRISSIEITEITDEFLKVLKNNKKVCNHLHIPLQSGNDKILKLMNRKYDTKYFIDMIKKIRNIRPDISITTDVIVGFPNESEEDFNVTYDFCKKIEFSKIHVFPYSIRKGTVASLMDNQIDNKIKKTRSKLLNKLSKDLETQYAKKFIGKVLDVLIEQSFDDYSKGHTSNYLEIVINKKLLKNEVTSVFVKEIKDDTIIRETAINKENVF